MKRLPWFEQKEVKKSGAPIQIKDARLLNGSILLANQQKKMY